MPTVNDLKTLDLDKITSEPLKAAIQKMLDEYENESDPALYDKEHTDNIAKLLDMVARYAPEALPPEDPEPPKPSKPANKKKEGPRPPKPAPSKKPPASKSVSGLLKKVLLAVIGDFKGLLDELTASDLEEADFVIVLDMTEQLEQALEAGDEAAVRAAVEAAMTTFDQWLDQMLAGDTDRQAAGKRAKQSFDALLDQLGIEKPEDDPVENQSVVLTHDLVLRVLNELLDVEIDLDDEDAESFAAGRLELEEAHRASDHADFRKGVQQATERLSYHVGDIAAKALRVAAIGSVNKLRNALGLPLLNADGREQKETKNQRSRRIMQELAELEPELERCRAVVREANKQKRDAAGKKTKPKPTRYTQLKKHMLAIAKLIPDSYKGDPIVQTKVKNLSLQFVNGFVEACQMSRVKAEPVTAAIEEQLEPDERPQQPAPKRTSKKPRKTASKSTPAPATVITWEMEYRDGANYKTHFTHEVALKDHPEANGLKAESEIEMGAYGTLPEDQFFGSDIHPHAYDHEYDHNILRITGIVDGPTSTT